MADTTTIEFEGDLLSPEQQKRIVEPLEKMLKGLQATAGKKDERIANPDGH